MKYVTQQVWHESQTRMLRGMLEVSKKAKRFSEEYFQEMYRKYIDSHMTEYLRWADEHDLKRQSAEDYAKQRYLWKLSMIDKLPDEIKDCIADIRMAALGYVTQDVYDKVNEFCDNVVSEGDRIYDMHRKHFNTIKDRIPDRIERPLSRQHDADVKKIGMSGNDYIIETKTRNREYIFTFKNASVIKDIEKTGCLEWKYDEMYLHDNGYEMHIMFYVHLEPFDMFQENILTDMIIFAEDIEVKTIACEPKRYTEFI